MYLPKTSIQPKTESGPLGVKIEGEVEGEEANQMWED